MMELWPHTTDVWSVDFWIWVWAYVYVASFVIAVGTATWWLFVWFVYHCTVLLYWWRYGEQPPDYR